MKWRAGSLFWRNSENINLIDRETSKDPYGYLIGSEPPADISPIWSEYYIAYISLINLYLLENDNDKVFAIVKYLSSSISSDGWYWNINKFLCNLFLSKGEYDLALEQYELAKNGLNNISETLSIRLNKLYLGNNIAKPTYFKSWDDQAKQYVSPFVKELDKVIIETKSKR